MRKIASYACNPWPVAARAGGLAVGLRHYAVMSGAQSSLETRALRGPDAGATGDRYDAFMSYSHEADGDFAPVLQAGVEKFAKPWNRVRALRIFRDNASLSAEPKLWPSIERALSVSTWFLLLASEQAARSRWVDREVQWWLNHRGADRLLLVATHARLGWDERAGDFDRSSSEALPPSLRGAFKEEPRWVDATWSHDADHFSSVDPRLQEAIADISSRLRGVPKDALVGAAVREHRRTRRIVRGVQVSLATLLLVSVVASVFALVQRSNAIQQATLANSRQLAAASESNLNSNLNVALLLAVKAYRTNPNPLTRAALLQADLYSPRLVRFLPLGDQVATLAGSADRSTVVAGLTDGDVARFALGNRAPQRIASLGAPVNSVAMNRDGRVIAATNGSNGVLWRARIGDSPLPCPDGQHPDAVGVSPSGRTVVVYCQTSQYNGPESIEVVRDASRIAVVHPLPAGALYDPDIVPTSDEQLFILNPVGSWQWRRISDWSLEHLTSVGFGAHNIASGYSSDGQFVTATNGATSIPVWSTTAPTSSYSAPLSAQAPINAPTALTLSPSGSEVAVADNGTVYVAPVVRANAAPQPSSTLTGNGSINLDALRFFGDRNHLLSGSGSSIAFWNLTQLDRLARVRPSSLRSPCSGCSGALAAVSPDGRKIAIVAGDETNAVIQPLDASGAPEKVGGGYGLGPPVWDGSRLLLPLVGSKSAPPLPANVHALPAVNGATPIVAAALSSDGRTVILVDQSGNIFLQNPNTGSVGKELPAPPNLRATSGGALYLGMATLDPSQGLVAIVDRGVVQITDISSGRVVRRIGGRDATYIAFAGPRLLVQRTDGSLEVWDARGTAQARLLAGDQTYGDFYPVADPAGELVARQRTDGTITLTDLSSGATLGTFSAPAPTSLGLKLGLAFSPNGQHIITIEQAIGANSSAIIDRDVSPGALIRSACTTGGRDLTPSEWRAFVGTSPPNDLRCR